MTLRVSTEVKAAAEMAAERDHRSVTSLIEVLILDHCKTLDTHPEASNPEETPNENTHPASDDEKRRQ